MIDKYTPIIVHIDYVNDQRTIRVEKFPEYTEIDPEAIRCSIDPERQILKGDLLTLIADNAEAAYRIRDLNASPWQCDLIVATEKK